jgi:uncharacterized damage-inducible protein DinB
LFGAISFASNKKYMKAIILKDLAKAKEYSIKVAEAMPENQLDYKPADEVMSFRELIHHLAAAMLWFKENYLEKKEIPWAPAPVPATKNELNTNLADAFNQVEASVKQMVTADEDYAAGYFFMMDHNAHHRGQAVTYLRCNGIIPPPYPF